MLTYKCFLLKYYYYQVKDKQTIWFNSSTNIKENILKKTFKISCPQTLAKIKLMGAFEIWLPAYVVSLA